MITIADIFTRELWSTEFVNSSSEMVNLLDSGIVSTTPDIDRMVNANDSGTIIKIPYIQEDLYTESAVIDDSDDNITVLGLTRKQADAFIGFYAQAWGQKQVVKMVGSGLDGIDAALSMIGRYWQKDVQTRMINMLIGAKASNEANESGDNVLQDKVNKFSYDLVADALAKVGDNTEAFEAIVIHSTTLAQIRKEDAGSITTVKDSELSFWQYEYNGMKVIVNDAMPTVVDAVDGDRIVSFLIKKGGIVFNPATVDEAVKYDENALTGKGGGSKAVVSNYGYLLSLNGYSYTAAAQVGVSPTQAEVADATNWERLVDAKQAPFIALETLK
jgi:hypothetical protein